MLVDRLNAGGSVTGNTNVIVLPGTIPPGQLMPHLNGITPGSAPPTSMTP